MRPLVRQPLTTARRMRVARRELGQVVDVGGRDDIGMVDVGEAAVERLDVGDLCGGGDTVALEG